MEDVQVTCQIPDGPDKDTRIDAVGGQTADGAPWLLTQDQAIALIRGGELVLYVDTGGHPVRVLVRKQPRATINHLQTDGDGLVANNLAEQEICSPAIRKSGPEALGIEPSG